MAITHKRGISIPASPSKARYEIRVLEKCLKSYSRQKWTRLTQFPIFDGIVKALVSEPSFQTFLESDDKPDESMTKIRTLDVFRSFKKNL